MILTSLIFLVSSLFFISSSIKYELEQTAKTLPQIIVQKIQMGRLDLIKEKVVEDILQIHGVSDASARVWGYYHFQNMGVNYVVVGLDKYEEAYKNSLSKLIQKC